MRSSTSCAEAGFRAAALCIALGGSWVGAHAASLAPELEVKPAWDGWSRPGRLTEVGVDVRAREDGAVTVRLVSGGDTVTSKLKLDAGRAVVLHLPVRTGESVAVDLQGQDGGHIAAKALPMALSEAPLLAWVAPQAPVEVPAGFHAVAFEPAALPRTAAGYSSVDALVIDRQRLMSLEHDQLAALLAYVAGCGRTILVRGTPEDENVLRGAAGCRGDGFAGVPTADDAGSRLEQMLAVAATQRAAASDLAGLTGADLRSWNAVVGLLAACAAVVAIAGIVTSSLLSAVVVPALAAAAVLAYAQMAAPDSRLAVWADADSGQRVARYGALQSASALRRGAVEMPVLGALASPQACRAESRIDWTWDPEGRRYSQARFDGRLFAAVRVCYSGEFPVARALSAVPGTAGRVMLRNDSASSTPPGRLAWNGRVVAMRAQRPGQEVAIEPAAGSPPRDGAEELAVERTPFDAQAMLWPLDLTRVADAPAATQGWLLMRVQARDRG